MAKMINLLGNSEDLIEQFMLENDPSASLAGLKKDIEHEEKVLENIKDTAAPRADGKLAVQKIEDLEHFLEDNSEDDKDDEDATPPSQESLSTKEPVKKAEKVETDTKDKDPNRETGDATEYSYENIINYLAQEGIVDLDEDEEFEDSETGLTGVIQSTINKQIDGYKKGLPTIAHEFIDFIEKGGDYKKFLGAVSGPIDFASLDLENEADQEILVKEYLRTQDYDNAEIAETLESYKDSISMDKQATIAQKKLIKMADNQRKILVAEQEAELKVKKDNYNTYISSLTKTIKESKSIAGLEIKDRDKDDFQKWLLTPGKDGLTGYQREVQENPIQTQVELAFLKYKKYDFSKVAKAAETAATKKIKLSLTKTSDRNPRGSTGSNLGDSEEGRTTKSSNLSGFRSFLS